MKKKHSAKHHCMWDIDYEKQICKTHERLLFFYLLTILKFALPNCRVVAIAGEGL